MRTGLKNHTNIHPHTTPQQQQQTYLHTKVRERIFPKPVCFTTLKRVQCAASDASPLVIIVVILLLF